MTTLAVSAAINIAISLAFSAIAAALRPDVVNEGPRLQNNTFTSAAYGTFINIPFGTDRMSGVIIDTQDPPLEEVVKTESAGGKGFGGPSVTNKTYEYFLTCDIAYCIEGADALIKVLADKGKVIYDRDATTDINTLIGANSALITAFVAGLGDAQEGEIIFYPGGPLQDQDPEEVSRRGGNVPAYRHLTRVKLERVPVKNYGNRIPNLEAVVSFNAERAAPFIALNPEPSGFNPPGATSGADSSHMMIDPFKSRVYGLKNGGSGVWAASLGNLDFQNFISSAGFAKPAVGLDGFAYLQNGTNNVQTLLKVDAETGETVGFLGNSGIGAGLTDTDVGIGGFPEYGNGGKWYQIQHPASDDLLVQLTSVFGTPHASMILHMGAFGNGSLSLSTNINASLDPIAGKQLEYIATLDATQGFESMTGLAIPDHDRGFLYMVTSADSGATFQLMKIYSTSIFGEDDGFSIIPAYQELRRFTRGDPGDDFESSAGVTGWAVARGTGYLIISNGANTILYDPDTDTILASNQNAGFVSEHNYYNSDTFAYATDDTGVNQFKINVMDTRTLEITDSIDIGTVGFSGNEVLLPESCVWDDLTQAVIFSRVNLNTTAPVNQRIVKVFVGRLNGLGIGLDELLENLSTKYQRLPMAGFDLADVDASENAGINVPGYTINNAGTIRSAIEPLRGMYFFDGLQEDWLIKFPQRGRASVLTIPSIDVGLLHRGEDTPPIEELRTNESELPMRVTLRYKNKDIEYNIDAEQDKRHQAPIPTMFSRKELTVDVPIVEQPTVAKRAASRHLLDQWHQRREFKTVLPWRYMKLSPTDVFKMNAFDETLQLRMTSVDLGANLNVEVKGKLEDSHNNTSTVNAGSALGFVRGFIKLPLPTRLIFLDAPILNSADFKYTTTSNAYIAMTGYEDGWPGGAIYRSSDDSDYVPAGTSTDEAATAKVNTPPSAWDGYTNRFQETADGGTLIIQPLRRSGVWTTATELQVLNGGNALAVITDSGVEILQYQTATVNTNGTITLSRLLRGRLGTEDVVDANTMAQGDVIVFLTDPTGAGESGPIVRTNLPVSALNTAYYYRGVTLGTLLEDSAKTNFAFSGRDLKPYAPVGITFTPGEKGGATLSWTRRCRGPFAAEWLDGTGTVPLNETIQEFDYEIDLDSDSSILASGTVDDATSVSLTVAEVDAILGYDGVDRLTNGDLETGVLTPWTQTAGSGTTSVQAIPTGSLTTADPNFPAGNPYVMRYIKTTGLDVTWIIGQTIDLTGFIADFTNIDTGKVRAKLAVSLGCDTGGGMGVAWPAMVFLDGSGNTISTHVHSEGRAVQNANNWFRQTLQVLIPSGTRQIIFQIRGSRGGAFYLDEFGNSVFVNELESHGIYDNFVATLSDGDVTTTIRIWQVSDFIGRGIEGNGATP